MLGGSPKLQHTEKHLHQLRDNRNHSIRTLLGSSDRLGIARSGFPSDPLSPATLDQLGLGDLSL